MRSMIKLAAVPALALAFAFAPAVHSTGGALADGLRECTTAAKDAWKPEADIKKIAEDAGYEVRKIKVEGTCYEVYGVGSDGKLMEIFYNPETGEVVHTEEKS